MEYCTVDDVKAKIQHITIDENSKPPTDTVSDFCVQVTALTDIKIKSYGLTLPITDSTVLDALRSATSEYVAAMVLRSIDMESDEAKTRQQIYDSFMRDIKDNPGEIDSSKSEDPFSAAPSGTPVTTRKRRYNRDETNY